MYLKRLEMNGFKSFPEKIRLEFNTGITAVVGPNGSGKSNVSDAIRWVLGEQSAKSLRGSKMEDVIFAGTANRRALGFAEVSMTIDNSDNGLKVSYEEVTITRRVYRSGEGEYYINGASCRLKDVHELFMDTGIGKEGYSIIGQGKIEEILSSKGEERRNFFEEAAGIVKYKTRRFEALSKLERERQNLERVSDIITEIEGNLEPLFEQSEKAKEYLKLAEELKQVQMNVFINEVETTQERIDKIDENIQIVLSQSEKLEQDKITSENDLIAGKELIILSEDAAQSLNHKIAENRSEFEQTENDIVLKNEQIQHVNSEIDNINNRINEKSTTIEQNKNEIDKFNILSEEIVKELEEKSALLEEKNKEFAGFSNVMTEEEQLVEKHNSDIIELMQTISDINSNITRYENMYEQLESRMEQINTELSANVSKIKESTAEEESLNNVIEDYNNRSQKLINNLEQLLSEKEQLSATLAQNKELLRNCAQKLHEAQYRSKMLTELENSYEGYQKSVKTILSHKKSNPNDFKGIIGAVGELISVDKKYETAIEIALGGSIQNIVTENEADAKAAIEYLKKNNSGRATFLPLTSVKPRNNSADKNLLKEDGVVGAAFDLLKFDERYKNIFSGLLYNTVVVDTMDNGIRLAKKYNYSTKLVTLTGELFNPGGAITGGSISDKVSGIFSRKRELSTLSKDIIALTEEENGLNNIISGIKKQLDAVDFQRDESQKNLQAIEVGKSASCERLDQIKKALVDFSEKTELLNAENKSVMEQIVECNNNVRGFELAKRSTEDEITLTKNKINELNQIIITKRIEKDHRYNEITELKVEITALEEKQRHTLDRLEDLNAGNDLDSGSIERFAAAITKRELILVEKQAEIQELMAKKDKLKDSDGELRLVTENENAKLKELKKQLLKNEENNLSLIEQLSNLNNEMSRLQLQKEHIDDNLRKIYDTMWEEYEITYNQAKGYPRLDKSQTKLISDERSLKNSIKNLGNVNVSAIEEYKNVSERYEFLTKQSEDIKDAEAKLMDVIAQLSELMENQFREHFAIISSNFSSVFNDIFGGGTAYLKLSDENNVLESGIDIIAKPPGKALQSLSLLSGGERTLTATALLFAILRMKPSPFCILDEIESALDDANVVRYVNYLQNFCTDTQFVLITHRKSVMEAADVLYGITMQEQGVSALVSVKFENESA